MSISSSASRQLASYEPGSRRSAASKCCRARGEIVSIGGLDAGGELGRPCAAQRYRQQRTDR